jgi:hypothetical protein
VAHATIRRIARGDAGVTIAWSADTPPPDLDWPWLVRHVKQHDLQNRLGFVITVARQLAERWDDRITAAALGKWEHVLEPSRLQKEEEFAGAALTDAERRWLRANRSAEAAHWNVLSTVSADSLTRA